MKKEGHTKAEFLPALASSTLLIQEKQILFFSLCLTYYNNIRSSVLRPGYIQYIMQEELREPNN